MLLELHNRVDGGKSLLKKLLLFCQRRGKWMGSNGWLIKGDSCIELKGTEIGERRLKGAAAELMFKLGLRTLRTLVIMK